MEDGVLEEEIRRAARLIREGKLVAFPTETVYGLGANALDPAAVRRIYEAKGRPPTSPLIVHVGSVEMARTLSSSWPPAADRLVQRYWPGPLTLVVPKHSRVPEIVTAGLATVGVRIPAHPVALRLIMEAGVPIAAPSANRFGALSPTRAEHVREGLGDAVDLILDGGPTRVGIESTVLSVAGPHPRLLRPGIVSRREIEDLIGPLDTAGSVAPGGSHPSPGLHQRHYSPATRLVLVRGGAVPGEGSGAYLALGETPPAAGAAVVVAMPAEAGAYAALLYDTLHSLDRRRLDWIAVELPPDGAEWAGVRDRLERAAG